MVESNAQFATIGGGQANRVSQARSVVAGGASNEASGSAIFIGGGLEHRTLFGTFASTIGGGQSNSADGTLSVIGGGINNETSFAAMSVIGGGSNNSANNSFGTVGGGVNNRAGAFTNLGVSKFATVGGGSNNAAIGFAATIPGGSSNVAGGSNSFAAGNRAIATNGFSFVWGGAVDVDTSSTNSFSFTARAPGGVRFITSTNLIGAVLASNATAWAALSDSNAKTDIEPVNAREVLKKVAALPVTSWHYRHDLNRRYIGPMAQDFNAAFGLGGSDDKTITTLDTDGVTLAAIQGLVEELKERDARIAGLEARLEALTQKVNHQPPSP